MIQITKYSSVKGSLQSIANKDKIAVAQAFINCEILACLDVSPSMTYEDCPGNQKRFKVAANEVARLQAENPGKVGLICWSDGQRFLPGGIAEMFGESTDVAGLLRYIKKADGAGIKLVIISDGEPDDDEAAISEAKKFKSKIHAIYIGPECTCKNGTQCGADFLKRLSAATGGQFSNNGTAGIGTLAETIQKQLTA